MLNIFEAGITLHVVETISPALGKIAQLFTKNQTAADALNARLKDIAGTFKSGLIIGAGGMALATPLIYATHKAMELQTALGRVQIATGASESQMKQLNDTLTKTANITGIFSKPKLAEFAAEMYASGITNMNQLNAMLPMFAQGADLMKIMSGGKINAEDAAHTFSSLAHQFGRYDEKSMRPIIQAAVAMAPSLPGGIKTLQAMGAYVNVMGNRTLGVDPVRLMALEAAIAQTSGGRGTGKGPLSGAQLINALQRSLPGVFGSGLLQGKSAYSAEVLGLAHGGVSTVFKDDKLNLDALIGTLSDFQKLSVKQMAERMLKYSGMLGKSADQERTMLHNILKDPHASKGQLITQLLKYQGGSASTIMQVLSDEKFKGLLQSIEDRIKKSKSIEEMQAQAMKMLEPQLMRLQTNFDTLAATVGKELIPVITPVITQLGNLLDVMNDLATKHPTVVRTIVAITACASAAMILGGAALILKSGLMGLQLVCGPVGAGITAVMNGLIASSPWFARFCLAIGAANASIMANIAAIGRWILGLMATQVPLLASIAVITIAIAALVAIIMNWDKICEWASNGLQAFGRSISAFIASLGADVGKLGKFIAGIPGLQDVGIGMMQGYNKMMQEAKAKAEAASGAAQASAKGGGTQAGKPTVINQTNNVTMQQVPGHDHDACWKKGGEKLARNAAHAAGASSGNSVARPINSRGASRP